MTNKSNDSFQSEAKDLLKDKLSELIFSTIKKKIIEKAVTKLPFLGWKLVNPFLAYAVEKVLTLVYNELETLLTYTLIDMDSRRRLGEYQNAIVELKRVMASQDEQKIKEEVSRVEEKLRNLIRFPVK